MIKRNKRDNSEDENGFAAWGGYMAAKKAKLQEQFSEAAAREGVNGIFCGVSIFVNGYTVPSADSLRRTMMLHGGTYHQYQTDKTTHIVASNLPNCKMKQLRSLKVVKPSWITDSVREGKLLDYRQYLLYMPRAQTRLNFEQDTKSVEEAGKQPVGEVSIQSNMPAKVRQSARNATEPNFLTEFYNNSRLHHISTMGAMFKQHVARLREESDCRFPERGRLREWKRQSKDMSEFSGNKVIMHIDMDCFFVSVGLRDKPHLRGLPVAVTHGKGNITPSHQRKGVDRAFEMNYYRKKTNMGAGLEPITDVDEADSLSEIASCSYEARKCGLKNGMFLGAALKLCPNLRTIPYDFEGYKEVSHHLYNTIAAFTLDIEAVSCDELYVDCTDVLQDTSISPLQFASFLRQEIKDKTGCTASAGFGANRLQARLATKKAKPNGQFHLEASSVAHHMLGIPVEELPGVGRNLASRLRAMDIRTCTDLKCYSMAHLQNEYGPKTGSALYKHCRGEDDRVLNFGHQRKSVSAEVNYGIRFSTQEEATTFLKQLAGEVAARLREIKMKGRCVTLKLMVRAREAPVETAKFLGHGVCDQITRSSTLAMAVADEGILAREVLSITRQLSFKPEDLRGIGIQVSRLESDSTGSNVLDNFLVRRSHDTTRVGITAPGDSGSSTQDCDVQSGIDGGASQENRSRVMGSCNVKRPLPSTSRVPSQQDVARSVPVPNQRNGFLTKRDVPQQEKEVAGRSLDQEPGPSSRAVVGRPLQSDIMPIEFHDLDKEVLAALPEDIRQEVLQAYRCNIQDQKNDALTPVERCLSPQDDVLLSNSMTVDEIRTLVKQWVSCEDIPQSCDVAMLGDYLERLVANRNLDKLDQVVRCLHRCVDRKRSHMWQCAYHDIVMRMQKIMRAVYGAGLKIQDTFTSPSVR